MPKSPKVTPSPILQNTVQIKGSTTKVSDPADYVPPPRLLRQIVKRSTDVRGNPVVEMPLAAFSKLLEAALNVGFNEAAYLNQHKDVAERVAAQQIPSGLSHFASHGFFEGRAPLNCAVDEKWYLETYPDVEDAIRAGHVDNATHHFQLFGYGEGRVPSQAFQRSVGEWHVIANGPVTAPTATSAKSPAKRRP